MLLSLASVVSKIIESIMKEIMDHLLSQSLLSEYQFGFTQGDHASHRYSSVWTSGVRSGQMACRRHCIYLQTSGRLLILFPHQRLLNKLEAYW